ncbi:protein of unassigned function [Methylobacterium oryzae CBMB20]|uniref:Protein of unassigned function n=1 Tax=Methylobacterium oryzae CBMB20 TaxID=693986 RepID=A0A089NU19_9HYPH|nr:protein of unassigned function [Methylobacterium oryzae CBMB20]
MRGRGSGHDSPLLITGTGKVEDGAATIKIALTVATICLRAVARPPMSARPRPYDADRVRRRDRRNPNWDPLGRLR